MKKTFFGQLLCLFVGFLMFSCSDKKEAEEIKPDTPLPLVHWLIPKYNDTTVYEGTTITAKVLLSGDSKSYQWKINETQVTQGVTVNDKTHTMTYTFATAGTYQITFVATNDGGTRTTSRKATVKVLPPSRLSLLTNGSSKVWALTSIKISGSTLELIKESEKDDTYTFFKDTQQIPNTGTFYNYFFDSGLNQDDVKDHYGTWELLTQDTYLKLKPRFDFNTFIKEISESTLILEVPISGSATRQIYTFKKK